MTTTAGHTCSFYIGPIGSFYYQVNDTGSCFLCFYTFDVAFWICHYVFPLFWRDIFLMELLPFFTQNISSKILMELLPLFYLEYFIKNSDGVIAPFLLRIFHQKAYSLQLLLHFEYEFLQAQHAYLFPYEDSHIFTAVWSVHF